MNPVKHSAGEFHTPENLWNRSYIFVLIVSTLTAFSFYMTATIMREYLLELGMVEAVAGVIVGLFSITSLFCRPFIGFLADRMNNIRLLIISCILQSIGLFGFSFVSSTPLIVALRIINGVGFALCGTVQVALIVHFIPKNKTGEGIGYIGISQLIGSACAPAAGMAVADSLGMNITFLIAAALPLVAMFMLMTMYGIEPPKKQNVRSSVSFRDIFEPDALSFTLPYLGFSFTNGVIAAYLRTFGEINGIPKANIGIYFTIYAVCLFLVRPISGKLMDQKGIKYPVIPGIVITALSMIALGYCNSLWLIVATGVVRAIGQGAAQPSLQAGCINYVGRERSGVATSTYYLGGDIGQGVAPMIGGYIMQIMLGSMLGYRTVFMLCSVILIAGLCYFLYVCKKKDIR